MTNKILKSSFHEKLKMLLILLGVFLVSINQVWAGPYMEEPTLGLNSTNRKASALTSLSLGDQTSLVISYIEWYAKKSGGDLWGDGYLVYGISGTTGSTTYWGSGTTDGWRLTSYDWYDSGNTCKASASPNTELCSNRKPGDYEMYFYFKHRTGSSSAVYYSNNNNNYHVYWTIPDPTITISGFSSLVAGTAASVSASISSYPVGATLTKLEVSGNVASVNKTGTGTSISSLSFTPNASGSNGIKVTVTVTFGSAGTKTYDYYYNVSPPAVSDFTITASSGSLGGSGTSASPYLVTYNGSITFGLSGATKAATDNNSSAQYSTDGTNYGTTGTYISKTHSSVTQTTNQNWKYKARLKNNSAALYGTVKEKTVYWKVPTSTITLHDNNGGSHNGSATTNHGKTSLTISSSPTYTTGYHVEGYYTNAACTTKVATASGALQASTTYTDSNKKWKSTGNETLYAKWAINTYTIAFNANDDNYVGTATGSTASIAATYGTSYTLTANGFSREGYNFAGWTRNADGTGTSYTDGQSGVSNLTTSNNTTVTLYAKWTGLTYTVSFNPKGGTGLSKYNTTVTMGSTYGAGTGLGGSLPTVTPPAGYVFDGWYTAATGGTKVLASTQVTIAGDHTLYAHYVEKAQVYFKNTLGWSQVWVTYDANWDGTQGTGNQGKTYHRMNLVPGTTDVYYDDIPDAVLSSWKWNIAFNNLDYSSTPFYAFDNGEAVYRMDFDRKSTMFVPTSNTGSTADGNYQKNGVQYRSTGYTGDGGNPKYTSGYWRTYNNTYSGYTMTYQKDGAGSWSSGHKMESSSVSDNVFIYTVNMDANSKYNFAFYKERDVNTKSVQFNYRTQITSAACSNLKLVCDPQNAWMQTSVAGNYTFKLEMKNDGHMYLTVVYPFGVGDYRIRYDYTKGSEQHYYSEIIKGRANGKDTISVFIHSADSVSSRALVIEKCTAVSSGSPTWNTSYATVDLPAKTAAGQTYDGKTTSGVYNFIISQNGSKAASGALWKKHDGNYYIRTDVADGGWDLYKYRPDNLMTLSEYSLTQTLSEPYSHYYCRFIESTSSNITFTIATDYSPGICPIMAGDATIGNAATTLPSSANVRFSWNEETNKTRRAYLKNAQGGENTRFLVLHGKADNNIFNDDATGTAIAADPSKSLEKNELLFEDLGNWIYQVELKAKPNAAVSLIANYNNADRYLIGSESSWMTIMGGSGSTKYEILAVYDFKTNRLMTVWIPGGDITQTLTNVDVLLIRHAQEAGQAITFNGGSLTTKKVYGALEFRYSELVGRVAGWTSSSRPLLKFFISFPFDVNVSDIFGLNSAYGDAYEIQTYDGAERARKGFFRGDGTTTFWRTLQPGEVMKANEGYCVIMDNDYLNNDAGHVWDNKGADSKVYLYFPSAGNVGSITSTSQTISIPSRPCTIDRTFTTHQGTTREVNHKNTDSHWNMMGIPIFANTTGDATEGTPGAVFATSGTDGDGNFNYYYQWNSSNNQFSIQTARGETFKSMHSYMVQYYGNVTFTGAHPAASVARRAPEESHQLELQVLNSDEEVLNRAYVELRENACDTFALNEDVYMWTTNQAVDIYTFAGNYDVSANVLSLNDQMIPVGIEVRKAGTYIFSMPSNFSGTATLVDTFTGARTNLALSDYEVELEKGIITDRFMLELSIEKVTTVMETVNGGGVVDTDVRKVLIDGVLYIVKDGKVFDARGARVQ